MDNNPRGGRLFFTAAFCLFIIVNAVGNPAWAATSEVSQIKLAPDKVEDAFKPRRLTLLVGIQNFKDQRFRALQYPEKDVRDVQDFLRTHNSAASDRSIVLLNDGATSRSFLEALNELDRLNTSENDIVMVYLSTHGTLAYESAREIGRFAVMNDTDFEHVNDTGISLEFVQNRLSRLKSTRKALVLALCHSGSGKSQLPPGIEKELSTMKSGFFAQPLHEVSSAMMVLSASSWGQPAREDNTLRNDIYTHFLLEGLSKHDTNGDGAISLFEAHEFARTQTYDFTRGQQTPTALLNLQGTDPIILNGRVKAASKPMVFADSEQFRNLQLVVNGESKGSLWEPRMLEPGRVRLTLLDPRNPGTPLMDHSVYMKNDQAYPISSLIARQPSWAAEIRAYNLPLPQGLDGLQRSDFWTPGINLRGAEILGTRLNAAVSYFTKTIEAQQTIDYDQAEVALHTTAWRGVVGLGYYPFEQLSLSADLGLERLAVTRTVSNATVDRATQQISLVYPVLAAEARFLRLYDSLYAGLSLSVLPVKQVGLRLNDETRPLSTVSGAGMLGFSF